MDPLLTFLGGAVVTLAGVVLGSALRGAGEHRRWIRETRHRLYAEFVEDAYQIVERGWELDRAKRSTGDQDFGLSDAQPYLTAVLEQGRKAETVFRQMELVASRRMRDKASSMAFSAQEFEWAARHFAPEFDQAWQHLITYEDVDDFVEAARLELGADTLISRGVGRVDLERKRLVYRLRRLANREEAQRRSAADQPTDGSSEQAPRAPEQ